MKNKDTVKEIAELCANYGLEIMKNTEPEDEGITFLAWRIFANANDIIKELEK